MIAPIECHYAKVPSFGLYITDYTDFVLMAIGLIALIECHYAKVPSFGLSVPIAIGIPDFLTPLTLFHTSPQLFAVVLRFDFLACA